MDNGTRLLVLSILEGRHFPNKQHFNIIIDAKFDGESLSSDPKNHVSNPTFNLELAWEIDRRSLRYLHIRRDPLKLQAYAINSKTGGKESIGYIILDTRQAHDEIEKAKPKWYPFLNSKYNPRPELLMCLGLEKNVTPLTPKSKLSPNLNELDEDIQLSSLANGWYQIGPTETCTDVFVFSFTVGFPANLESLINKATAAALPKSYFFYYSLLGNDVITDTFSDINLGDFSPERASIKIKSSLPILRKYFNKLSPIQVHLCSGETSLGSAEVLMSNFIKPEVKSVSSLPILLEDCFEIKTSRHSQLDAVPDEIKPKIGIVMALRIYSGEINSAHKLEPRILNSSLEIKKQLISSMSPPEKLEKQSDQINVSKTPIVASNPIPVPKMSIVKEAEVHQKTSLPDQSLYFYELTIELESIKNLSTTLMHAFVRYSWAYFGNVAPIFTDPPVFVTANSECILPQGSTTVTFATLPSHLKNIFSTTPIPIEVLNREVDNSQETVIGKGDISLAQLISGIPSVTIREDGKTVKKWTHSQTVPVFSVKQEKNKLIEVKVNLILNDTGLFDSVRNEVRPQEMKSSKSGILKRSDELASGIAEQVALELEQWKEWQENLFKNNLKEKEKHQMETLAAAWTQKETERETLFKKRLLQYNELEDKLKAALDAVEKRERQLASGEAELQRLKSDLQSEYDRLVQEVKDVSRRVKEECMHKIELEKNKTKAKQDQSIKLQRQVAELEKKLEMQEAEFQAYKDQKDRPEIRLQSQINVLNLEKAELERKNSALLRSKIQYKQQYSRCLKELARLKQAMQLEAEAELREKKKELCLIKLGLEKQTQEKLPIRYNDDPFNDMESANLVKVSDREMEKKCLNLLMSEKENLIKTGLYSPSDAVIAQLDKEIQTVLKKING